MRSRMGDRTTLRAPILSHQLGYIIHPDLVPLPSPTDPLFVIDYYFFTHLRGSPASSYRKTSTKQARAIEISTRSRIMGVSSTRVYIYYTFRSELHGNEATACVCSL